MLDPNTILPKNQALPSSNHSRQMNKSCNTSENYTNFRSWNDGEEDPFRAKQTTVENCDSGASTPPLWGNSNSPTPLSPQHRLQSNNHLNYRAMSPNSRTQAIARGQTELMDLVSRMPEGCYELSLKDLVEHPIVFGAKQESSVASREKGTAITTSASGKPIKGVNFKENKKKSNKKAVMNRSGSFDNGGLFLKMVFPVSFGWKKAKLSSSKNNSTIHVDGKVSPRPLLAQGSSSNDKGVDQNEWWRKGLEEVIGEESSESVGLSSSGKSGSSKSSGRSSSSSSRRRSSNRHGNISCWSWIFKKGKRSE